MWLPMLADNGCIKKSLPLVIMNIINLKGGLHATPNPPPGYGPAEWDSERLDKLHYPYSRLFSRHVYFTNSHFNSCSRKLISRMVREG